MTKHYVLNLDPTAKYDWEHCTLRDPITAAKPELAQLVADAIGGHPGAYLISVDIQVTVLEQVSSAPSTFFNSSEAPVPQPKGLVA